MNYVTHTITLKSDRHFGKRVPSDAIGRILFGLPPAVRHSIRMAFERRSTGGHNPAWLDAASDIRFVDHEGEDETILYFESPLLGEAAEGLYGEQQLEFWSKLPAPDDTGFDLLGDVLSDVAQENADSERFDSPLLRKITAFRKGLNGTFQGMRLSGHRYTDQCPAILDLTVIQTAERFCSITPTPEWVRIVGTLDMIRASTNSFALKLNDGQEVRGVLLEADIEKMKDLFKKEVLVLGRAVYRPSQRLLRVDADRVSLAEGESSIWSHIPEPRGVRLDVSALRKPQGPRSGVAAIIGKWPGDETDSEIQRELEAIS